MRTRIISLTAAAVFTFGGAGAVLAADPSASPAGTGTTTTEPRRDEGFPIGLLGLLGLAGLAGLMGRERKTTTVTDREAPRR